jgi:hypothetical protein
MALNGAQGCPVPARGPTGEHVKERTSGMIPKMAHTSCLIAQIGQQPVRLPGAGQLINPKETAVGEVNERGADMADDDPAEQDDPQPSGPQPPGGAGLCARSSCMPAA